MLTSEVTTAVKAKTQKPFVLRGSVAMYALLNELRSNNQVQNLMMLEQRIAGGKNDFDVAFLPDDVEGAMNDFGWDEKAKSDRRSVFNLAEGEAMIDVLGRAQLPNFPWVSVPVVSPMEGIFERMSILSNDETPNKQIKWGVDVKILKAYLQLKNGWDNEQLESELARNWEKYQDDVRYQGVQSLIERHRNGEKAESIVRGLLRIQEGTSDLDLEKTIKNLFPEVQDEIINKLLNPSSTEEFELAVKSIVDISTKPKTDYVTMSSRASSNYLRLISEGQTK